MLRQSVDEGAGYVGVELAAGLAEARLTFSSNSFFGTMGPEPSAS